MSTQFATVTALPTGPRPIEKCKNTGQPDDWFPNEPTADATVTRDGVEINLRAEYEANARKLCKGCPLIAKCLSDALDDESEYGVHAWGVYGGRAPWERDAMRRSEQRRDHRARQAVA